MTSDVTTTRGTSAAGPRLVALLFAGLALAVSGAGCGLEARATKYEVAKDWPKLPAGTLLGQVSGVGIDPDGLPLVFRRAEHDWVTPLPTDPLPESTILRIDPDTGELVQGLGAGLFAMPHGLTVDPKGHLWLTDVSLHQVVELDATGHELLRLGERGVPGVDEAHFNMPTDVAVAEDGTFFVSDGYGNSRVVRFSPEGRYELSWGSAGSEPGQFLTPHGIALGPDGDVYVADRGNARVQVFDQRGNLKHIWQSPDLGRPWSVAFDEAGRGFVVDGGDQVPTGDHAKVLLVDASGKVVSSFGSYGADPGQMRQPHDLAIGHDGSVYVVEVGPGKRVQKFAPVR
jgi:peptidylamidoglycolate lyase